MQRIWSRRTWHKNTNDLNFDAKNVKAAHATPNKRKGDGRSKRGARKHGDRNEWLLI